MDAKNKQEAVQATNSDSAPRAPRNEEARRPRAISDISSLVPIDDAEAQDLPAVMPPPRQTASRRAPWLSMLLTALAGLIVFAGGLAIDRLVRDLFARSELLGWTAAVLAAAAIVAVLALSFREIRGLWRLAVIEKLRQRGIKANEQDNAGEARVVLRELDRLYRHRPDTAGGRAQLALHKGEIIDGRDLIRLAERDLLAPLDATARRMVTDSAKRVSVVTAVSPRALVDLLYVLFENARLIRRLSELYGGRPGTLGMWRLVGRVITHLAATGAIAVGDGIIQQIIGHGMAARLSARLGEGVVNGLLTARIGLSAIDMCRPLAFIHTSRPGLSGFLSELATISAAQPADKKKASDEEQVRRTGK
jgi:putative membrane protein